MKSVCSNHLKWIHYNFAWYHWFTVFFLLVSDANIIGFYNIFYLEIYARSKHIWSCPKSLESLSCLLVQASLWLLWILNHTLQFLLLKSCWYQLISFENTSTLNLHFSGFSVKSIFFVFSRLFKPIIFVFSKPIFVFFREQWHSGSPRLTQTFILLKSIKWVLRISGYLLVKSKLPSPSGSIALNHFLFVLIGIHSMQSCTANYNAWSYKKKKHRNIKVYRKSV